MSDNNNTETPNVVVTNGLARKSVYAAGVVLAVAAAVVQGSGVDTPAWVAAVIDGYIALALVLAGVNVPKVTLGR
ncbi:MAG: hypothetical protein LBS56_10300 [Propionibacteriaceae bacterium]|jgi:hypothetical protein|nr:hypothetical protein [Propionibacteriaceae bacterium]